MRILCLSDIHGEAAGLSEVLAEASECELIIIAGDVTHLGGAAEAEAILGPVLSCGVPVLAVAGNIDREGVRQYLGQIGIDLHARGVLRGTIGFMGLGGGTVSPFGTPWELEDAEASRCLAEGFAQIREASFKVLVSHVPPSDTKIDRNFARMHVGSRPVHDFLLTASIDLCLCGHIHEAWGEDRVGKTHCVNIGPFKNGRYALVTIDGGQASIIWRKK
jgi:Icc-related predicted phosphoesterase